jgi:putative flavoprotein involved in K+ transport
MGAAQTRLDRVLAEIDRYADMLPGEAAPDPPPILSTPASPSLVDLERGDITGVVWATGYRPWYPWLRVPALNPAGQIRHRRGVTDVPGLYAIGLRFQHRRNSTFVDGARHDAAYLADHIAANCPVRGGVPSGNL